SILPGFVSIEEDKADRVLAWENKSVPFFADSVAGLGQLMKALAARTTRYRNRQNKSVSFFVSS
nr:hypothetical protein [Pseudomonas sp.]